MRFALVVAVTAMVAAACGGGADDGEPRVIPITADDGGTTVEVAVGDHLQVELEANPSTGFSWVDETEETATIVAVGEPQFVEQADLVGAPGIMRCMFEARATGEATIELTYRRAWEEDVEPERVFEVTVVVRDP